MVVLLLTLIYIMAFEIIKIDLRLYLMMFIVLISMYRASKNLKTSIFAFLDFYPIRINSNRIREFMSSLLFFLYFYIKTEVTFNITFVISLFTFSIFFYYYFFRDLCE